MIFESISKTNHEEVVFCQNQDAGLKAIIAIHDTTLGPALGGCRMWPYADRAARRSLTCCGCRAA